MKRKLFLIGMLVLAVASIGLAFALSPLAFSGVGVSIAMAGAVAGPGTVITAAEKGDGTATLTEQNIEASDPDILIPKVRRKVVEVYPAATPLDSVLQMLGSFEKTNSFVYRFYSSGVREIQTQLRTAIAKTTSSTAATSENKVHTGIQIETPDFCDDNETLMFNDVLGGDGLPLTAHVVRHTSDGQLDLVLINGFGTYKRDFSDVAVSGNAIEAGTYITRIGNAMNEKDAKCNDYAIVPSKEENYVQILMSALSEGDYQKKLAREVDYNVASVRKQVLYDFKRKREHTTLWGHKAELYIAGKNYYHMDGIVTQIARSGRVFKFDRTLAMKDNMVLLGNYVFNGNNGASTRYMFCGSGVQDWIGTNIDYTKMMDAKTVELVPGLVFKTIETQYGTINVKFHPDFDNCGWANKGLIIDPANIELHTLKPMGVRSINNTQVGTELSQTLVMEEAFTTAVLNANTHCLLDFKA